MFYNKYIREANFQMKLRGIDLNLLPVLRALLQTRSVNKAADMLGMSQPAVSHALKRLRFLVRDPLLLRVGQSMRLTTRAEELHAIVNRACSTIEEILAEDQFDPAVAERNFTIAAADYTSLLIARELLPILRETAPGVHVDFIEARTDASELLRAGKIDLMVGSRSPSMQEGLCVLGGFFDQLVCVTSLDHPLASQERIHLRDLADTRRLMINIAPHLLLDSGVPRDAEPIRSTPSHLLMLPLLAAHCTAAAVVPGVLARILLADARIRVIELDGDWEPLEISMSWGPVQEYDRAHKWLRGQVSDILSTYFTRTPQPTIFPAGTGGQERPV